MKLLEFETHNTRVIRELTLNPNGKNFVVWMLPRFLAPIVGDVYLTPVFRTVSRYYALGVTDIQHRGVLSPQCPHLPKLRQYILRLTVAQVICIR